MLRSALLLSSFVATLLLSSCSSTEQETKDLFEGRKRPIVVVAKGTYAFGEKCMTMKDGDGKYFTIPHWAWSLNVGDTLK